MDSPVRGIELTGRRYAQAGVVFGLAVSTWANVAQAWGHGWGARLMAAVWPTIVYLAIEVLARTTWTGRTARFTARASAAIVGMVAAYLSYQHLSALLASYGEPAWSARLGPLGIDGLMAVCAAALLTRDNTQAVPGVGHAPPGVADSKSTPRKLESGGDTASSVSLPTPAAATRRKPSVSRDQLVALVADHLRRDPDASTNAIATGAGVKWDRVAAVLDEARAVAGSGHGSVVIPLAGGGSKR